MNLRSCAIDCFARHGLSAAAGRDGGARCQTIRLKRGFSPTRWMRFWKPHCLVGVETKGGSRRDKSGSKTRPFASSCVTPADPSNVPERGQTAGARGEGRKSTHARTQTTTHAYAHTQQDCRFPCFYYSHPRFVMLRGTCFSAAGCRQGSAAQPRLRPAPRSKRWR